jgi:hypothetical protein
MDFRVIDTTMNIELSSRRRETVSASGRGAIHGREQRPGRGSWVERIKVVERNCRWVWRVGKLGLPLCDTNDNRHIM